jgi:hypothetical protein
MKQVKRVTRQDRDRLYQVGAMKTDSIMRRKLDEQAGCRKNKMQAMPALASKIRVWRSSVRIREIKYLSVSI